MIKNIYKRVSILLFFTLYFGHLHAQSYDNFIKELVREKEWFALENEYPRLEDSIMAPDLKWVAKAMIDIRFNQSREAIASIDTLLYKYKDIIGFNNSLYLYRYKLALMEEEGEYGDAADELTNFMDQVAAILPQDELRWFEKQYDLYNRLRYVNKPKIVKPEKDVLIPFGKMEMNFEHQNNEDTIQGTTSILGVVKMHIQGNEYMFILDTGAEKTTIFTHTANQLDLEILIDSISLYGTGVSVGKLAFLDSFSLGEITFSNSIILITDNFFNESSIFKNGNIENSIHGILGIDFIKRLGEMHLYPGDKKIVIPMQESELPASGRNIYLDERKHIIVKSYEEKTPILFHLDTGNSNSQLFKTYFIRNREQIESNLQQEFQSNFGIGGKKSDTIYLKPSMTLLIGDTFFSLERIPIYTANFFMEDPEAVGSLGMDFINQFNKITLNLNKRFIQLVK